jgi:hypothetical protein
VVALCIGYALWAGTAARACAIDQRPSASANGRLAHLNPHTPTTSAQLATWGYFIFPGTFRVGADVTLTENRAEVARTLEPSALRDPWGWQFGDGTTALGWTVRHAYARPGPERISVYAYDPAIDRWTLFDQITITIVP